MATTKKELHPSGDFITFNPRFHQYSSTNHPKKKFISGTKFLSSFFGEFDSDAISAKYAKKHNMSQTAVLKLWARKGEVSREAGSLIHDYLERRLLGETVTHDKACFYPDFDITESAMSKIKNADAALEEFLDKYEFIRAEMIVASLTHDISGMIDLLCRNKKTGRIVFADWKTNASIDFKNSWQSGLPPIDHLDDCSYNRYSLQMGIYQRIAVEETYLTGDDAIHENIERVIIHIKDDGHKFIPCPDLQKEVNDMIMSKAA